MQNVFCTSFAQNEVLTVFDMVALSAKELCGLILGKSCETDYNPWDQEWNVTIPGNKPPVKPVPPPKVCFMRDLRAMDFSVHRDISYTCS